ncbi:MAG: hypothetical protein KDJ37_07970 [Hyphomicrobiaceae bacterium]|nr:hypothetical protein [Hyphomicrobiaceae bacterium]
MTMIKRRAVIEQGAAIGRRPSRASGRRHPVTTAREHAMSALVASAIGAIVALPMAAMLAAVHLTVVANAQSTGGASVLTAEETGLNCRKMAGRMQVRILELRGPAGKPRQNSLAEGLQSAVTPIFGGTKRGANAADDFARDVAKLREMNTILKARNCPHYDLDAELAQPASAPTPRLIRTKTPKK